MKIINTYDYKGEYYRGNLHTHSENSPCGHYSLDKIVEMYTSYKMEYDFLAITDHCMITDLSKYKDRKDILLIEGVEFKRHAKQTLGINVSRYNDDGEDLTNHQEVFNDVESQGGINIICHPNLGKMGYWTVEEVEKFSNYTGIEVFNNNVRMDCKGFSMATNLWDELLSKGRRIWGFANDDMHIFSRVGGGCNYVLAEEKTIPAIIEAMKRGSFYLSFGVKIKNIEVKGDIISLEKGDDRVPFVSFKFIGRDGKILKEEKNVGKSCYKVKGNEGYIRVEVYREDGCKAWTQPFFIEN